jgi:hypothetical protein
VTTDDLDLARQRRQLQALEAAEEDRWLLQRVREVYEAQEEADPGFPEKLALGGPVTVTRVGRTT